MEPMEKFNKMCQAMRDLRPAGQEASYLFFVGDAQPPNLVLYLDGLLGSRYGMITIDDLPSVSADARQRCVQFAGATYVTSSIPLAAALTFQPEVAPSQSWYGPVLSKLEGPKPVEPPVPKRRSSAVNRKTQ